MKQITRRGSAVARILILLAVIFLFALSPAAVLAHANLLKSDPQMGAILPQAPKVIRLEFSEDLDPALSRVRLLDRFAQVIAGGPGKIDPANPRVLTLDLPDLTEGTYTAVWTSRSATDAHSSTGSVIFSVGRASPDVSLLPPAGVVPPSASLPDAADVAVRWALYLGAALLGGSLSFAQFVWRPAFQTWPAGSPAQDGIAAGFIRRQALLGALILGLGTAASAISQAALQGTGTASAFEFIFNLRYSWWFWLRLVLGAGTVLAVFLAPLPGGGRVWAWRLLLLPAAAVLASFSLTSHSAGSGSLLAVGADFLHLAGMSAWFGGLPLLFLAVRRSGLPAEELVPRFSRLALACVAVLGLTGLYSGLVHIGSLEALFGTTYGAALLVKLGLFGILFGLGALNLLVITPRLKQNPAPGLEEKKSGLPWLARTVPVEMAAGLLLLAAVGVLTASPPANDALQADRRVGYIGSYQSQGVSLNLWVAPGRAGDNEIAVDVNDPRPQPAGQAPEVLVRFLHTSHTMGQIEVKTASKDGRRYTVRASYLSMAGAWLVEVVLNVPGLEQVSHQFQVSVAADPKESTLPNPVPASPQSIAAGKAAYAENCAMCHGPTGKGDGPAGKVFNPRPADLTVHGLPGTHTDGQLFLWIGKGIPGSAMPGFVDDLGEEEVWNLVNYLHALASNK